ncbi:MAG TPA: IS21 family transposase [Negativicutes bacterium]|nr:IS21 family transposase [Negativicutes bacterium]
MIQINHIKNLSYHRGQSIRSICRETGYNFRTVAKYIEKADFNAPAKKKRGRPSKLDVVKPFIDTWLTEDLRRPPKYRHTAKRIYDRLCQEHAAVFSASERTVRDYVALKKKDLFGPKEGPLPLEHPPGEAQADFGEVLFFEKGKRVKGYELVLSFPYSNGSYVQIFKGQNQECLLTGLKEIFEHISKVPTAIWFDNLSAAVVKIIGPSQRQLTEQFERFCLHYGFEPHFCNPDSGHEKGHVENKVGYGRRNFFVPEPCFDDIEEFNQRLFAVAEKDMRRQHYLKQTSIAQLMGADKQAMLPLPTKDFEVAKWQKSKANNYGKVRVGGNTYSASPMVAGKEIWVKSGAHTLELLDDNYRVIVTHPRLYGGNQESMNWLPYLATLIKRPTALKYTGFYRELPDVWQGYLDNCSYEQKKASLRVLQRIITESNMDTAVQSLETTIKQGATDPDSVLLSYYRLIQEEPPELTGSLPWLTAYQTDLSRYDLLLKGGDMR